MRHSFPGLSYQEVHELNESAHMGEPDNSPAIEYDSQKVIDFIENNQEQAMAIVEETMADFQ